MNPTADSRFQRLHDADRLARLLDPLRISEADGADPAEGMKGALLVLCSFCAAWALGLCAHVLLST